MSLIEQAAKRLEQLRRSGAALPEVALPNADDSGLEPKTRRPASPTPTPEAVVNALNSRKANVPSDTGVGGRNAPSPNPVARISSDRHLIRTRAEIDLVRLGERGFVTPDAPNTRIAHEFRVLKRPILRNAQGRSGTPIRNGNLIMVTSSLPGEGKTFTAANLAISMAMEFDNSVLLVDGDVAHPSLPEVLGLPAAPGLLDLLVREDLDVGDVLLGTNIDKLTVLPAGSRDRRATELLASEKMANLLGVLATRYPDRIIIFDSPPLLATTEARVLATHMGQIVMVVAADSTSKHAVSQALATIENCEVVLMMLNRAVKTDNGSYYGYYADDVPI